MSILNHFLLVYQKIEYKQTIKVHHISFLFIIFKFDFAVIFENNICVDIIITNTKRT